jgi:chromosomal replication initiator protein
MTDLTPQESAWVATAIPVPPTPGRRITDIQLFICAIWRVTHDEMLSPSRFAYIVRPRHIAIYLTARMVTKSSTTIGRRFGGRDHSSIIHALRKMRKLIADDPAFAAEVAGLQSRIERTWHDHGATQ